MNHQIKKYQIKKIIEIYSRKQKKMKIKKFKKYKKQEIRIKMKM